MFDTTKEDLKDLLKAVDQGKLQLPEFQRSYVWNDADLRSLLASVLKGFPVGALLTLETGGNLNFKPRLIEGVPDKHVRPNELLLDGQQRITSLYQATFSKAPVKTKTIKNVEVQRHYYLDIAKALFDHELEDAIVGVPADKIIWKDFGREEDTNLSSKEREFDKSMFPLDQIFDASDWLYGWKDYKKDQGHDVYDMQKAFHQGIVDRFTHYKMPIIRLSKENSREAICTVFEKVNVGGKKLDAFELVTAIYASDNYDLRHDWDHSSASSPGRKQRIVGIGSANRRDVVSHIANTEFLQACTLLHTRAMRLKAQAGGRTAKELPPVSCKHETLLALPLEAYQTYADGIEAGFIAAAEFLNEQKIIWHKDVPYPAQSVALSAVSALLGTKAQTAAAKEKLARWFWCVVFGELYGASTETRLGRDVPQLVEWIEGGAPPESIDEALFQRGRLETLRVRQSAAYKGLHALMMREGCRDFISGQPTDIMTFFQNQIDIHHIFPRSWCLKQGIKPDVFNSIINKTPLSKRSNIAIQGDAPSSYLRRVEEKQQLSPATLDSILRSHLIEPAFLRADDFVGFFQDRREKLAGLVASAMGKPVVDRDRSGETGPDASEDDGETEELMGEAA